MSDVSCAVGGEFLTKLIQSVMATQKGPFKFSGRMGDFMGSQRGGELEVHMHKFIEKEDVATRPSYDLVRKNLAESKGAAVMTAALAAALGGAMRKFGGRNYQLRVQSKLLAMLKRGPGNHGARAGQVQGNAFELKGLDLNRRDKFGTYYRLQPDVAVNTDRNEAVLTVPSFTGNAGLTAPAGAELFELKLYVGALSDHEVGATRNYEALNPTMYRMSSVVSSGYLPVTGAVPAMTLTATLPGSPVLPATAGLVVAVSIEFFIEINSVPGLMAQGNALMIVDVY